MRLTLSKKVTRRDWAFLGLAFICLLPSLLFLGESYRQRHFIMRIDITDAWRAGTTAPIQEAFGAYEHMTRHQMLQALRGPMKDSLDELLGTKMTQVHLADELLPYAGGYDVQKDNVLLSPLAGDKFEWRMVWVHELAHSLQTRHGAKLGHAWRKVGKPNKSVYAARGSQEHQAEAIALSILWLQTAGDSSLDRREMLIALRGIETMVPGTMMVTKWWLTHPLYREHSWRVRPEPNLAPSSPPWSWEEFKDKEIQSEGARVANAVAAQSGMTPLIVRGGLWVMERLE